MESWIMDLRYTVRRLLARPTYALLAVLTLALGVGGTAAILSIVRGLLLEPLPYEREAEVAVFWNIFDWTEASRLHPVGRRRRVPASLRRDRPRRAWIGRIADDARAALGGSGPAGVAGGGLRGHRRRR